MTRPSTDPKLSLPPVADTDQPQMKSRRRVADHGEVFTPSWMVEDMLDLVKTESERIDSRFLEPACGSGNFLIPVLRRKLFSVQVRYGKSDFERRHHALIALMSIYGIELLEDNVQECRTRLFSEFDTYLRLTEDDPLRRAAHTVLRANIVHGDALAITTATGEPIDFPEWSYLGKGKFQRRDFRFEGLASRASFEGTLWGHLEAHEIFSPVKTYPVMRIEEIGE